MRRFRGLAGLLATIAAAQVALGWIVASLVLSAGHSLYNHGHWVATKTTLAEGVLGAYSFLFDLQTLASGGLDLSAWHGYQEVVSEATFDPVEIEFDFALGPSSHLTFEFNRGEEEYTGIRMSTAEAYPPVVLTVSREGEFLAKEPFEQLRKVRRRKLHTLRLELADQRFVVFLDGKRLGRFRAPTRRPQRIGFRAGRRSAAVDDVRVVSRDGSVFVDDFGWSKRRPRLAALVAGGLILLSAVLFAALARRRPGAEKRIGFFFLMMSLVLVLVAAIVWGFTSYKSGLYPHRSRYLEAEQEYWKDNQTERIFERIAARYPKTPAAGTHRVLFIGASQTRGSGAERDEETLVRRTERLLDAAAGDTRVECINAAIHGYTTVDMEKALRERWIGWRPQTVVINAANNDLAVGREVFADRLAAMLELARQHGAGAVLVMEPNSIERRHASLRELHRTMAEVGERFGVPTVDMHSYLVERYDDGFLWWDWVHLTSYGQRLFAEHLAAEIIRLRIVEPEYGAGA